MPVIEMGLCAAKRNHSAMDVTTKEGQILQNAWNTVTTLPNGPHWAYGGVEPDDVERLWGFFEFDDVKHHKEFASTFGAEAVKNLPKILSSQAFQKHITIDSNVRPAFDAPATEVLLVYFQSDISSIDQASILAKTKDTISPPLHLCGNGTAASFGWSVEDDFPVLGRSGDVGRVLAVFVGWTSVDAAERFWEERERTRMFAKMFVNIAEGKGMLDLVSRFVQCRDFGNEDK